MVPVQELALGLRRVLALITAAREVLARAHELVGEATQVWKAALDGTADPELAQLPSQGEAATSAITERIATLRQAEHVLRTYLGSLGVGEDSPAPPAVQPHRRSPELGVRVEQARQRVGRATAAGSEARGEWARSDGWSVRVTSGLSDEHHDAVVRFARSSRLPPAVTRLARHVEVKVAVAMREQGLRDETVVIDRQICGTRPFDQAQPFTCDKYLARFLPPGARLRVVQADGTVATYTGKDEGSE
ncbi:DddA-like double-stranded DNA deaminase toxin [Amycolatopsis thermoflava]|uniref:DddA-like double-stranded DNA deaminase toxin n=1 Tax=Amycolatopsis thermoflava TaxID=84480 RepID=UPI001428AE89|nr:DddA-like double-stranded DNA deaminase toxin [Amycolatopsis thermoflava]